MSRGVKRFALFFAFLVMGLSATTTSFEEADPDDLLIPALSVLALTKPRGRRMSVRSEELDMMLTICFNELVMVCIDDVVQPCTVGVM